MAYINKIEFVTGSLKLPNQELERIFPDYNFDKFEKKVGIKSRYIADKEETGLSMAVKAVNKLLSSIDSEKYQIDFIIHCTQSPEYMLPTSACILQEKCGLEENIGALDINLGCSGYTYGLILAKSLIESRNANNVILVTSDTYSKYINEKDLINRLIFGDAATASLISANGTNKIEEFIYGTSGAGWDKLIVKNNFFNVRKESNIEKNYGQGNIYTDDNLYMDGPAIFDFTINNIPPLIERVLKKNKLKPEEVDKFIPHQANKFLLKSITNLSSLDISKLYTNLDEYGNTVSSTIPIALKEYSLSDFKGSNEKILIAGFGVGLSWSAGLLTLNSQL